MSAEAATFSFTHNLLFPSLCDSLFNGTGFKACFINRNNFRNVEFVKTESSEVEFSLFGGFWVIFTVVKGKGAQNS